MRWCALIAVALTAAMAIAEPVLVPSGAYLTTNSAGQTTHIQLTRPVLMDTTVVTVREFRTFVTATGHVTAADSIAGARWFDPGYRQVDDHPVVFVSLDDAARLANWRSHRDGLTPAYRFGGAGPEWVPDADGWRLPTEAEWEWAARCAGACVIPDDVAPAGLVTDTWPNDLGVRGLLDDVLEWCWDGYQATRPDSLVDPVGVDAAGRRVIRGLGLTGREWAAPDFRSDWLGIRLVRRADTLPDLEVRRSRQELATAARIRDHRLDALADSLVWSDRDRREPTRRLGGAIGSLGAVSALIGWSMLSSDEGLEDIDDLGVKLLVGGAATIAVGGAIYLAAGTDLPYDQARKEAAGLLPTASPAVTSRVAVGCRF